MVRNTQGGTGTKSIARKHQTSNVSELRVSEDENEVYGYIEKLFGNGMCKIVTNDGEELLGHIRGKMRGHQKRHNVVSAASIALVGLRSWETEKAEKKRKCDIITVYNDNEIAQLKEIPNINIDSLVQKLLSTLNIKEDHKTAMIFSDEIPLDQDTEAETVYGLGKATPQEFTLQTQEEISIDDI